MKLGLLIAHALMVPVIVGASYLFEYQEIGAKPPLSANDERSYATHILAFNDMLIRLQAPKSPFPDH